MNAIRSHGDDVVVELRRYTLHAGRRDELIELFERELVVPQEAAGMSVIGQFRDVDHADTFTWLRSFPDMGARRRALERFYGGPVWAAHRDAANATMIDSDDVHLLRFADGADRTLPSADVDGPPRRFAIVVALLRGDADLAAVHASLLVPDWTRVAVLETLPAVNDFPALPVHGARVAVSILATDLDDVVEPDVRAIAEGAIPDVIEDVTVMRLSPTDGSRLR